MEPEDLHGGARHKIQFPTVLAQGLFGVGWALLVFDGAKLVG